MGVPEPCDNLERKTGKTGKTLDLHEDFFKDPDSEKYDMILNFYSFQQLKINQKKLDPGLI